MKNNRTKAYRKKKLHVNQKLRSVLRFLVKFNLFAVPLYIILLSGYQLKPLMEVTTDISFAVIKATMPAERSGPNMIIPAEGGSWSAYVSWDSTGWKSMLALFALIFATEFPMRKKIIGLAFIPLVYAVNILRIWFMFFFVHNFGAEGFPLVHATIWSWGLILTIIAFWVLWMRFSGLKFLNSRKEK